MKSQSSSQHSTSQHKDHQQQPASSSVKKSAGSFFEKHAFAQGHGGAQAGVPLSQQQQTPQHAFLGHNGNVVSKIPSTSSSSYNMHRQNATRGDSTIQGTSAQSSSSNSNNHQHMSRDKPSAKHFSQNMLSKSQQFASLQFNQAMLSQQSYLAQGHIPGSGVPQGPPQMQQQNFIGSGLVQTPITAGLNTSQSQLNNSGNYETNPANSSQDQGKASPSKRHVSKTSMGKRKNLGAGSMQNSASQSGQPLISDGSAGGASSGTNAMLKHGQSSQSSLAQKRYSVSNLSGINPQVTANSGNSQQYQPPSSTSAHIQQQLSKQGTISKSESNNKLRRISNMKQKGEKSSSDRRNQGLITANNMPTQATGSASANLKMANQYSTSSNPNVRFMQQMGGANNAIPSNLKSSTTSGVSVGNGGVGPANMSNMTSFQQSHSERTSMTDEAHTSSLIMKQWQMRDGGQAHAQCSTERYTNDQRVNFMQQLHSANEALGTSQTSGTYPANASAGTSDAPPAFIQKKAGKEKLFFVTDHKLYEAQKDGIMSGGNTSEQGTSSNGNNPSNISMQKMTLAQHQQMMYDIETENIQVKQLAEQQPQTTKASQATSIYSGVKGCKKVAGGASHQTQSQASLVLGGSGIETQVQQHTKGAAAAPVSHKGIHGGAKQSHQSIICPIYQSKDFRLMTGQQTNPMTTKNSTSHHHSHVFNTGSSTSKTDQKDVKRPAGDRKDSNKGATSGQMTAARRSMSDDMHEDIYMAKSDHQKPRKRAIKATSVIESQSNLNTSGQATHHNNSVNSSENYERSHYQKMRKNATNVQQQQLHGKVGHGGQVTTKQQQQWIQPDQQSMHYSESSSLKSGIKKEKRDAEPLADKLLYLTNVACQSKVKSKSQLSQSMKGTQGLRKGIKSPGGTSQSTLQEPSAKAMPTSSKVKISQKFNKFEQTNLAMKMPGHPTKQNLFQTKTLKKQGSGPLNDFKEFHKSPEIRHGHMKKNGSISYAILPRTVIPSSDLKAHKKLKSPSPSIKLQGPDPLQRMRSPQTVKAPNNAANGYGSSAKANQSAMENYVNVSGHKESQHQFRSNNTHQQSQQLFEARRLSQQRPSHLSQKPPQISQNSGYKSNLLESNGSHSHNQSIINNKQYPQSVSNSISQSKRISLQELHSANAEGANEAQKLYCMVDSRKNSQSSLLNAPVLGQGLQQVQILQVDSQGNQKTQALNKVQLKTKEKLQNYMGKPPGFLSQSPKAKKHGSSTSKHASAVQQQSSMLMTQGSTTNPNHSQSKLTGVGQPQKHQQKFVHQMQAAYSSAVANNHVNRELLKNSASQNVMSTTQKALLQIQAPKVVHLQSPPSRILVKASPRVSPNPKIRKQGIQTCKVSIDALQKNNGNSAQQKITRPNSKEFLKTIKLMKRGSNSPSPSGGLNQPAYLKSSQGSPVNTSHHQVQHHQPTNITRGLQANQHHDSTTQLKNYNSQPKDRASASQNSNSMLNRQTSQNNKLFSRLQLRRAKEAQLSSINNNELVSFSERQTQDFKAASTASLLNPPSSIHSNAVNLGGPQLDQYSSIQDVTNSNSNASKTKSQKVKETQYLAQSAGNSSQHAKEKITNGSKVKDTRMTGSNNTNIEAYSSEHADQALEKQPSSNPSRPPPGHDKSDLMPRKQRSSKIAPQNSATPTVITPNKKQTAQAEAPVSAVRLSSNVDKQEEIVTRQAVQTKRMPKTETLGATAKSKGGGKSQEVAVVHRQHGGQLRPDSKHGGVLSNMSNEELREQAQFIKDLEKLKRMIRLHFQNYNSAPPTTCEFYRIGRVLGKGAFGKVSLAMHKLAEQLVAIKSMSKETLKCEVDQRRRTKLEMGILMQCNHPNVVRLFDTFETTKHICFVIELCSGGDLFSYIKKRRRLKEDVARFFFKQLIEGLAYIHHAKKVVHRDIKLENILLDATGNVKICDFGVSRQLQTGREKMKEQCGTPAYIAPEILIDEGYHGFKVDMWSAGVCLYAMLIGSVPFKASTMSKLQDLIIKGEYDFKFQTNANSKQLQNPKAATSLLSEEVQDLIARLLTVDPNKRLSAVETLHHPWLQQGDPNLDVYTEKEKQLIQREYMRLNLKISHNNGRLNSALKSTNSHHRGQMTPPSQMQQQETEQILFTEHNLETRLGEEEPELQNQEEKSFILAPFNSVKSMFIDAGNQIKEIKKDDPPFEWPKEVTELIAPRRIIKFSTKCREKNRIYEQNNNADLDNGVYNEFVNEQEREEGALMNNNPDDENKEDDDSLSDGESRRHMVSQDSAEDLLQDNNQMHGDEDQSEDSLERSFKETELASDDDEATEQMAQAKRDYSNKKPNEEAFNLLQDSVEEGEAQEMDEEVGESPSREKQGSSAPMTTPIAKNGAATKKNGGNTAMQAQSKQQSLRPQIRPSLQPSSRSTSVSVREYKEPEFVIDNDVTARVVAEGVIPQWYLLQELEQLKVTRAPNSRDRGAAQRMNYITATYFLLVKRRELAELQRRQEGRESRLLKTPQREEQKKAID